MISLLKAQLGTNSSKLTKLWDRGSSDQAASRDSLCKSCGGQPITSFLCLRGHALLWFSIELHSLGEGMWERTSSSCSLCSQFKAQWSKQAGWEV